ncbi:MAG: choice-of-anchor L domain-containing protein [Myxococcaceae bacterium]|nr:choice-of-anchor L domain-containing protein [Myxococcaceae bacterium]
MRPLSLAVLVMAAACARGTPPAPDGGTESVPDAGPTGCTGASIARCDGECVNLDGDARHCGACDHACPKNGYCDVGTCTCPVGAVLCGDECVDLDVDSDHCGSCGNACAPGTACIDGACVLQCSGGARVCNGVCTDVKNDPANCGACGKGCTDGKSCRNGTCKCAEGALTCNGVCVDPQTDPWNCGGCGKQCFAGYACVDGACACPAGTTDCQAVCADLTSDPLNCGGCGVRCQSTQSCVNGFCDTPCPVGWLKCNGSCVDPSTDAFHCGACGHACGSLSCQGGQCVACNSATTDCDSDGWTVAEGDCCDQPGSCGLTPALINPGAIELIDGVDNNCNGLVDAQDQLDIRPCDSGLLSDSLNAIDYAKALGICRTTPINASGPAKTWGLISAELLQADGSPIVDHMGHSIRSTFGATLLPQEGRSMVVLSSGAAADETQTSPGPNGGPGATSLSHNSSVDLSTCTLPYCIGDWFSISNPPLKGPNALPEAPGCTGGTAPLNFANDSVMLVLTLRAPTNAKAFEFKAYFLSSEYPEYVCTDYNDQLVALVDTPNGGPIGAVNPVDKNLMTYFNGGQQWPIGINVAHGTSIFRVCEDQTANNVCWDTDVSTSSCANGASDLAGTGFEASIPGGCTNGGATGWLTTTGNVRPGELVTLRIAIWDAGDHNLDSLALLDSFHWLTTTATPGTTD